VDAHPTTRDIEPFDVNAFDIEGAGTLPGVRPGQTPIGLQLTRSARLVSRAFDDTLEQAGGSLPVWLVLLNLKIQRQANQRRLAEAVGVTEATLTHHLGAMERAGLLVRRRDPSNRRNHLVELTAAGEAAFTRLAAAARAFDQQLRTSLKPADIATLRALLDRLCQNVATSQTGTAWEGLIEGAARRTRPKSGARGRATPSRGRDRVDKNDGPSDTARKP
jgi:MarR family transcriptional regulator, transcriptional regulator for hemolysin